jgi:uncharacterized protein YqjF (DUF2071 family)
MNEPNLLARLSTRDYPKNATPVMHQRWEDLLFLHWEYDPEFIQKTLPPGLHVDLFDGKAYVGLTPFFLKRLKPKLLLPLPEIPEFLEMNLRTYVYDDKGTPGVWFYSLDANNWLAVQTARSFFHLPYFYATMESYTNEDIAFRCKRQGIDYSAEFLYRGIGSAYFAEPNSLDFFLIERYILFVEKTKPHLAMARIHHAPYALQEVQVSKWDNQVFEWNGLPRPNRPPDYIHYSSGVDVEIFSLQDLSS